MPLKSIVFSFALASCTFLMSARPAASAPIKAAVVRSTGTLFLGQTIWNDLNTGWANFGDTQVQIDFTSLAGHGLTLSQINNTQADVLIVSAAGFMSYTDAEVNAVKDYVQSGHDIIITYSSFMTNKRAWAPLVGLSDTISLGTGTATDPFWLEPALSSHPLFDRISQPYVSGVRGVTTQWGSPPWSMVNGTVVAELLNDVISPRPGIVTNQAANYRGLYFSYYIENKADGSNLQDMQMFYNGLLWTAGVPEPGMCILVLFASMLGMRYSRNGSGKSRR